MSEMRHNAVLATTWNQEIGRSLFDYMAEECAAVQFDYVVAMLPGVTNGYVTVVLVPDGSKEGWPESDEGDRLRELMRAKVKAHAHEDGSSPFDWVEVDYGHHSDAASVTHGSDR